MEKIMKKRTDLEGCQVYRENSDCGYYKLSEYDSNHGWYEAINCETGEVMYLTPTDLIKDYLCTEGVLPFYQKENAVDEMIEKYDGSTVIDSELDDIWENVLVKNVDNMGWRATETWWSVEFINGSTMDIYTKEE